MTRVKSVCKALSYVHIITQYQFLKNHRPLMSALHENLYTLKMLKIKGRIS